MDDAAEPVGRAVSVKASLSRVEEQRRQERPNKSDSRAASELITGNDSADSL